MPHQLKKDINVISLLFTSLSCMIGSGWLFGSLIAAQMAGPASIISWVLGGILICFIATCFSELSTTFPVSGGIARYSQFSHGSCVSFIIGWLAWLSCVAVAPTEAQAILQYASRFYEGLTYKQGGNMLLTYEGMAIASVIVFLLSWINIQGVKTMIKYNNVLTTWKILTPFIVLLTLLYHHHDVTNLTAHGFMPHGIEGVLSALSTAVIFSYLGFRECTSLASEVKNPQKAIPLAAIGSVVFCMILYVLMQVVFILALDPQSISQGWSSLSFAHDSGPFAGLAIMLGIHWLAIIIYVDSVITPTGTALVYTATTSRLLFAMSKNGFLPKFFERLNINGVPKNAVIVNAIIGLAMFYPLEGWQALVKFQSVAIVMAYAIGPISLLSLRIQAPQYARPFKLPASRFLCHITFYICLLLVYWSGWATVWRLTAGMCAGLLIFLAKEGNTELKQALWLIPFSLTLLTVSYLGQYDGGISYLSTGLDFLVLLLCSIPILEIAVYTRLENTHAQKNISTTDQAHVDSI